MPNEPTISWKYRVNWDAFLADGMRSWWGNCVDVRTGEIVDAPASLDERYILLAMPTALHGDRGTLRIFSQQPEPLCRRLEDAWFALRGHDRETRQARRTAYRAVLQEATGVQALLARDEELARKDAMTRRCAELSLEPPPFVDEVYRWRLEVAAAHEAYTQQLLTRLDTWLRLHAAPLHAQLQPGLSADALTSAEVQWGSAFSPGLRALYGWRNGCAHAGFYFNYDFLPLSEAMQEAALMRDLARRGDLVWRDAWLPILDKRNGDSLSLDLEGTHGGVAGQLIDYDAHRPADPASPLHVDVDVEAWLESYVGALERGMFTWDGAFLECTNIERYFDFRARFLLAITPETTSV